MPGQPLARFAFRSRESIVEVLQIGNLASDMQKMLREVNHSSPDNRTLARICYHGLLMRQSMALGILKAFKKYANENNLPIDNDLLSPNKALVEFNCEVVGLGGELSRATSGLLNADVDHVDDIAKIVGTLPQSILQVARGRCILVPEEFARAVAIAASQVLKLPQPLAVRPRLANETEIKPLGGAELEAGKAAPYACEETSQIRADVLQWLRGGLVAP